jgi:hypothetical protein
MKVYKTGGWRYLIEEVEATRINEKSVWFLNSRGKEERNARLSEYSKYFNTKEEAKEYLIERCSSRIESYKLQLSSAQSELQKLNEL